MIVYVFEVADLVNNWMRNGYVMGYMYANAVRWNSFAYSLVDLADWEWWWTARLKRASCCPGVFAARSLLQAMAEGDGEMASWLMRRHMLNAATALRRFIEAASLPGHCSQSLAQPRAIRTMC
ncbi:hypothetical protein [Rhizobium sp. IMFF44]|uniref:hypothetical protein n=1 Tax=unclassified Rhizobium TaxID=2613769 RepID=UPI0035B96F7A